MDDRKGGDRREAGRVVARATASVAGECRNVRRGGRKTERLIAASAEGEGVRGVSAQVNAEASGDLKR